VICVVGNLLYIYKAEPAGSHPGRPSSGYGSTVVVFV
jgi:hypothetical protein